MNPLSLLAIKGAVILALIGGAYLFATDWANERCEKTILESNEELRKEIAIKDKYIADVARSYEAYRATKDADARKHIKELDNALLRNPGWSNAVLPDDVRLRLGNKAR